MAAHFPDESRIDAFISNWNNLIRSLKSTIEFSIGNGHVLKGFPLKFEKYDNTMEMGTIYWNSSTEDYLTWFNYNVDKIAEVLLIKVSGNIDEIRFLGRDRISP